MIRCLLLFLTNEIVPVNKIIIKSIVCENENWVTAMSWFFIQPLSTVMWAKMPLVK